ncbi:hypothetical protein BDV32DRAFT_130274 [Aspergillus pseudonomiae]|nr:hypothetical protein BDV32DRAFT_130274 [Aspergillus pseudonomiae]
MPERKLYPLIGGAHRMEKKKKKKKGSFLHRMMIRCLPLQVSSPCFSSGAGVVSLSVYIANNTNLPTSACNLRTNFSKYNILPFASIETDSFGNTLRVLVRCDI